MNHKLPKNKKSQMEDGIFPSPDAQEPQMTTAGVMSSVSRKNAGEDIAGKRKITTEIIVHELNGDGTLPGFDDYLKNRGIVHRAMHLLEEWKFMPARISCSKVPVDIIALRKDMALLIQVISSKKPVPDAKTLVRLYAKKIHALRTMGTTAQFRKMLMAYSKLCGWKYYEVLPGGLIPAWDLPDVPAHQS
jgi:hypothetical protein